MATSEQTKKRLQVLQEELLRLQTALGKSRFRLKKLGSPWPLEVRFIVDPPAAAKNYDVGAVDVVVTMNNTVLNLFDSASSPTSTTATSCFKISVQSSDLPASLRNEISSRLSEAWRDEITARSTGVPAEDVRRLGVDVPALYFELHWVKLMTCQPHLVECYQGEDENGRTVRRYTILCQEQDDAAAAAPAGSDEPQPQQQQSLPTPATPATTVGAESSHQKAEQQQQPLKQQNNPATAAPGGSSVPAASTGSLTSSVSLHAQSKPAVEEEVKTSTVIKLSKGDVAAGTAAGPSTSSSPTKAFNKVHSPAITAAAATTGPQSKASTKAPKQRQDRAHEEVLLSLTAVLQDLKYLSKRYGNQLTPVRTDMMSECSHAAQQTENCMKEEEGVNVGKLSVTAAPFVPGTGSQTPASAPAPAPEASTGHHQASIQQQSRQQQDDGLDMIIALAQLESYATTDLGVPCDPVHVLLRIQPSDPSWDRGPLALMMSFRQPEPYEAPQAASLDTVMGEPGLSAVGMQQGGTIMSGPGRGSHSGGVTSGGRMAPSHRHVPPATGLKAADGGGGGGGGGVRQACCWVAAKCSVLQSSSPGSGGDGGGAATAVFPAWLKDSLTAQVMREVRGSGPAVVSGTSGNASRCLPIGQGLRPAVRQVDNYAGDMERLAHEQARSAGIRAGLGQSLMTEDTSDSEAHPDDYDGYDDDNAPRHASDDDSYNSSTAYDDDDDSESDDDSVDGDDDNDGDGYEEDADEVKFQGGEGALQDSGADTATGAWAVVLEGLQLDFITAAEALTTNLQMVCCRCGGHGIVSVASEAVAAGRSQTHLSGQRCIMSECSGCHAAWSVTARPKFIHGSSNVLCVLKLSGCKPLDLLPSMFAAQCSSCSAVMSLRQVQVGLVSARNCSSCHHELSLAIPAVSFVPRGPPAGGGAGVAGGERGTKKGSKAISSTAVSSRAALAQQQGAIQPGAPLPMNGACQHYKHSYRWLRFPCCGLRFACDLCHEECVPDGHEAKWASRMVCGFCSIEQPVSSECKACGKKLTASGANPSGRFTRFWEGGQGCRDKKQMDRRDAHKYRGSKNKTQSAKHTRVGPKAWSKELKKSQQQEK